MQQSIKLAISSEKPLSTAKYILGMIRLLLKLEEIIYFSINLCAAITVKLSFKLLRKRGLFHQTYGQQIKGVIDGPRLEVVLCLDNTVVAVDSHSLFYASSGCLTREWR